MRRYRWLVVNQSQSPMFQKMLGRLSRRLGPCLLVTGTPHPNDDHPNLTIIQGPTYNRTSQLSRVKSWARFTVFATAQIIKYRSKVSFVWSVTNPPVLPHLVWSLTKLTKVKTAILIWDLYPDHLVRQGWVPDNGYIVRAWNSLNGRAIRAADVTITIGNKMADAISAQLGDDTVDIHVVPNWSDTEWLTPIDKSKNPFVAKHGLGDKTIVMYSGNLGGSHGTDILVDVAQLLEDNDTIQFVIIGDGLGATALDQQINDRCIGNILRLPLQPWSELPYSLASGDIAIVSQSIESSDLSVPSKTYSAMAVGSTILALTGSDSDLAMLVEGNNIGAVCSSQSPEEIASRIRSWVDTPQERKTLGKNARRVSLEQYSEQAIEERLFKLFENLV